MLLLLRLLLLGRLLAVLAVERRGSPLACALRMVETWFRAGGWARKRLVVLTVRRMMPRCLLVRRPTPRHRVSLWLHVVWSAVGACAQPTQP